MDTNEEVETIVLNDEKDDSDCEIIDATPGGLVDVPDYIDPKSLKTLISEPNEELPPVIEKIVNKLSNDEEFERECDKFYKDNLDIDVEMVQVDVSKVISEPIKSTTIETRRSNYSAPLDDIRTSSDLPKICSLCEDSEDHVEMLLVHFREEHYLKDEQFVCPFCDYMSLKFEVVMKHTIKVHKLGSERHTCDQCDFQTFRGDLYNRHLNQHLKQDIYSCDKCNYKTINSVNYKKHLNSKHCKGIEYKCRFCEYMSNTLASVKKHENMKHMKERLLSCDKCPYKTMVPFNLRRHQEGYCRKRGSNELKKTTYSCVDCSFQTENEKVLEDHTLMKHPKEEILFCRLCEFSTTENSELTEHAKKHLKIEPDSDNS